MRRRLWIGFLLVCATTRAEAAELAEGRRLFRALQTLIVSVSRSVLPSVVHIEAIQHRDRRREKVAGSGFVIDTEGHIVTNEHVVADAEKIEVRLYGRAEPFEAVLVGKDAETDLALLRVTAPPRLLRPARLGDDTRLQVGEWVLAIGNPYGLDGTVSFGIVSAKGRDFGDPAWLNPFLQTDALLDFGSSGGPLVNLEGEVVGVNAMGQGRGIGFTIPISVVKQVVARLREGDLARGWLGVRFQPFPRKLARHLGLPELTGVRVIRVLPGAPAERAGIRAGDILVRIAGEPVTAETLEDLSRVRRRIAALPPGEEVTIELWRAGRRRVSVRVGERPPRRGARWETPYGFNVEEITPQLAIEYELPVRTGVMVRYVEDGTPASEAGLEQGDVVVAVEGRPVGSLAELRDRIAAVAGYSFTLDVRRGEDTLLLLLEPFELNGEERR